MIFLTHVDSLLVMSSNPYRETRKSERHPKRMAVVLLDDPEETENRSAAVTVDVSEDGCRIESEASLTPGQVVYLMPAETPNGTVKGRVVWIGQPASDMAGEAGIEFLETASPLL